MKFSFTIRPRFSSALPGSIIIVGKVKVRDTIVKGGKTQLPHCLIDAGAAKIMPESQRNCRESESAAAAAVVEVIPSYLASAA